MTARPFPLLSWALVLAAAARAILAARRPMPLASPPGRPDVVYGFGRIDASGRVADRVTIAALGWRGGDRLTVTAEAGVMIARRDPGGMVTVPARPYVVIPAALRRRCGLRAGDHVLLAASPGQDMLAAYSFSVVDQALRAHAPVPPGGEAAMTAMNPEASRQAVVEAALVLLERMGLSPADLAAVPQDRKPVPTSPSTSRSCRRRSAPGPGGPMARTGTGSSSTGVPAPGRAHAVGDPAADGLRQDPRGGPPQRPGRPQRGGAPCGRTALPVPAGGRRRADRRGGQPGPEGGQAAAPADHPAGAAGHPAGQINEVAATTGDDPELDTLMLRLHTETACRRGGALALRPQDLDPDQCLVLLREKGETVRWQPVSPP